MTDTEASAKQRRSAREMSWLLLSEAIVMMLRGFHIISNRWTIIAFFVAIIPFATLKAFADFRRRGTSD